MISVLETNALPGDKMNKDDEEKWVDANWLSNCGDDATAFPIFFELACRGHVDAIVAVGNMHIRGEGVPKDLDKGLAYLEQAASLGQSTAAFNLGALYRTGSEGVPRNSEKSKHYFVLARELGCTLPVDDYI